MTVPPRAAPALPKPGGIDTPGPNRPSANARTLNRIGEKRAECACRSSAINRRPGASTGSEGASGLTLRCEDFRAVRLLANK